MEANAEGSAAAAGLELIDTKSFECADGWAIVFAITKSGDIEQTTAFVYQAEGPVWAQNQIDAICADGGGEGVPANIKDQACALRYAPHPTPDMNGRGTCRGHSCQV